MESYVLLRPKKSRQNLGVGDARNICEGLLKPTYLLDVFIFVIEKYCPKNVSEIYVLEPIKKKKIGLRGVTSLY